MVEGGHAFVFRLCLHACLSAGSKAGRWVVHGAIKDVRKRWDYNRCCWNQLPLSRNTQGQIWNMSSRTGGREGGVDMWADWAEWHHRPNKWQVMSFHCLIFALWPLSVKERMWSQRPVRTLRLNKIFFLLPRNSIQGREPAMSRSHSQSIAWVRAVELQTLINEPSCFPKYSLEHQAWINPQL